MGTLQWAPLSPFLGLSSFCGFSMEANHHPALLSCRHHLSSFLSNFTQCCVTMVTMGQQFATENQGERKQLCYGAVSSPGHQSHLGTEQSSSHFMEGETEEQVQSLLNLSMEGESAKAEEDTPQRCACYSHSHPLQQTSSCEH